MSVSRWTKIKRTVLEWIYITAREQYKKTRQADMRCPNCREWFSVSGMEYKHTYIDPEPSFGAKMRCGKCQYASHWNLSSSEPFLCDINGKPLDEGDDPYAVKCIHEPRELTDEMRDGLRNDTEASWDYDSSYCIKCGEDLGHACPESPDFTCHYFTNSEGMVTLVSGSKALPPESHDKGSETDDECIFCGAPEERK